MRYRINFVDMNKMLLILLLLNVSCRAQSSFEVVPLGVKGGADESNLSAYAIAPSETKNYVCLDAGTLHFGIQKAIDQKILTGDATAFLRKNIKGYLISHPHLDHVSGLILNAPDDSAKFIYGIPGCLTVLQEKYFSWKSWANFGNEGEKPTLNKYQYVTLVPGEEISLANTPMFVTPYLLSHVVPNESTAFLIRNNDSYLLYLGDTGSDKIEKTTRLQELWRAIVPLIQTKKLKAIFIEVSFDNQQPENLLFGHLTPKLLMQELEVLSSFSGQQALKNFPIVITHRKPAGNREEVIKEQLKKSNSLNVKLIFPEQGSLLKF
jgi:cAMP phosphodiesterase